VFLLIGVGCSGKATTSEPVIPLSLEIVEYPSGLVISYRVVNEGPNKIIPQDARIQDLKVSLSSGRPIQVMEQRFYWDDSGGELIVRLGQVVVSSDSLVMSGTFHALDELGTILGVPTPITGEHSIGNPGPLDYTLRTDMVPAPDTGLSLGIAAVLARPLHASGLPGARIERLVIQGPNGPILPTKPQQFMPTADGGKIRIQLPPLDSGTRLTLRGWFVPLRADKTPCCGEQSIPKTVDVN